MFAHWQMSGPVQADGAARSQGRIADLEHIYNLVWVAWAGMGRPGDSFEDWLPAFVSIELLEVTTDKLDPTAPPDK